MFGSTRSRLLLTFLLAVGASAAAQTTTGTDQLETARTEVEVASRAWIDAFNRGDADACAAAYTDDAVMEARPMGTFQGREAIREFWRQVLADDPGTLTYIDSAIHVLDVDIAVLSSRWSMSRLGRGVITMERWQRQADGQWRMAEDRFEIREQHDAQPSQPTSARLLATEPSSETGR